MPDQHRYVLTAIAQRSNRQWENMQSIEQVASEFTVCNHLLQVAVSGGYHTDIHLLCAHASQPFKFRVPAKTRNSFGCNSRGMSPTSSRKRVPLSRNLKSDQPFA